MLENTLPVLRYHVVRDRDMFIKVSSPYLDMVSASSIGSVKFVIIYFIVYVLVADRFVDTSKSPVDVTLDVFIYFLFLFCIYCMPRIK